jgi:HPt (histidine-containing phosphotransfer) domain-containing protein
MDPTRASDPFDYDPDALERLRRFGGPKLLADMITLFLEALPQRLTAAREGARRGEAPTVEHALHALKSSSAQLGALRMHRLSVEGEQLAKAGTLDGVSRILDDLDDERTRVTSWLDSARAEASA